MIRIFCLCKRTNFEKTAYKMETLINNGESRVCINTCYKINDLDR